MADPITVGSLAFLASLGLLRDDGGNMDSGPGKQTPPSDGAWGFPLPAWQGYAPTRSQEYKAGVHNGVDIMYPRDSLGGPSQFAAGTPNGSRGFFMPDQVVVCAARDGVLWSSDRSPRGLCVVLDHGKESGFATFYQHMSGLFVPLGVARGNGQIAVSKGDPIGIVGYDPLDGERLMHLHFEVWYQGGAAAHVDPWPLLADAPLPDQPDTLGVPLV